MDLELAEMAELASLPSSKGDVSMVLCNSVAHKLTSKKSDDGYTSDDASQGVPLPVDGDSVDLDAQTSDQVSTSCRAFAPGVNIA
jgi:hypothetical protein